MEYGFLLVESRQLLSIGYDGITHELHSACYDLLASEARIASFIAVAKGDIPQQSWFRLDRSHVLVNGRAALLSWTGTMFEYMMPSLWMRTFPDTLIARSLESAVRIQREHVRNMPWGISESGFSKDGSSGQIRLPGLGHSKTRPQVWSRRRPCHLALLQLPRPSPSAQRRHRKPSTHGLTGLDRAHTASTRQPTTRKAISQSWCAPGWPTTRECACSP